MLVQAEARLADATAQERAARRAYPQTDATREAATHWQKVSRQAQAQVDALRRSEARLRAALPEARRTLLAAESELDAVMQQVQRDLGRARRQVLLCEEDLAHLERNLTAIAGAQAVPVE